MTPPEQTRISWIARAILLAVGCVPMILIHGMASLLMIFPLFSLAAGNWLQALFLLWWLIGTVGLMVLVYSSATLAPSSGRLPHWQVVALIGGMISSIPLILGFLAAWWASVSALLACLASGYILASTSWSSERQVGRTPKVTDKAAAP
ncbi:MAG TPA: hypothetical protein VI136_16910 [Verrucomicrobiae bacterium]